MAAIEKFTDRAVSYKLRHNTRENPRLPKNKEIDPERSKNNYLLSPPDHGTTARKAKDYYNQRLEEVYHMNRADVKTACQWVITAPEDLKPELQDDFFRETYDFLNALYGEKNCINCVVHLDEGVKDSSGNIIAGRPHMHYMFIPVVKNKGYMKPNKKGNITTSARYEEKVCADQLINKQHLSKFHPAYQKWLDDHGVRCTVHSGVTGGKNRTVEELKEETKAILLEREKVLALEKENAELKGRVRALEQEKTIQPSGWGASSGWGREINRSWENEF